MDPQIPAFSAARAARTVTMTVPLICGERVSQTLDGDLVFDPADPYALQLRVRPPAGPPVVWTFARDLLVDGLHAPTGDGDVLVWPCLSSEGEAVVIIELRSPSGSAMLQTASRPVHGFVAEVLASVPVGHEADRIDLDEMVAYLLGR